MLQCFIKRVVFSIVLLGLQNSTFLLILNFKKVRVVVVTVSREKYVQFIYVVVYNNIYDGIYNDIMICDMITLRRKTFRTVLTALGIILLLLLILTQFTSYFLSVKTLNTFLIRNGFYSHLRDVENFIIALRYSKQSGDFKVTNSSKKSIFRIPKVCYQTWVTNQEKVKCYHASILK